jgi:hypothetical protein
VPRSLENVDGCSGDDMSKFLARQVLGMDLPKFSGDVKKWPTFITTFRRKIFDFGFSDSENTERLRKCLSGSARNCVKMILMLSKDAEKAITMLTRNYGRSEKIVEQLLEEAKAQKDHLMFRSFQLNNFFLFFFILFLRFDVNASITD